MKKRIKINGFLTAFAIIICFAFFKFLLPSWRSTALNISFGAVAFTFFLSGQILRILGRVYKVEHSGRGEALVKEGPYAVVRNPMYLGSFLMGISFVILLGNLWIILAFLLIFFIRFIPQVRVEEKILLKNFGKAYQEYSSSVPRFFPKKITKIFKGDFKKYLQIKKFPWIKKEIWAAVGWLALFLLIAFSKDLIAYSLADYIKELVVFAFIALVFLILLNNLGE